MKFKLLKFLCFAFLFSNSFAQLQPAFDFRYPVDNLIETQGYNAPPNGHTGVDWAGGGNIYAVANGIVVEARNSNATTGWGTMVRIMHILPNGDTTYSQYAHMQYNSLEVEDNDIVSRGDIIGIMGNTGYVEASENGDGTHLHFEIKNIDSDGPGYTYGNDNLLDDYYNPTEFIENNSYLLAHHYTFPSGFTPSFFCDDNSNTEVMPDYPPTDTWRVHVTGDNPGIVSPEHSPGFIASNLVAHFSMKIIGTSPMINGNLESQAWVKDQTGDWENPIAIELINDEYGYDPDADGNTEEFNDGNYNVYRINFQNLPQGKEVRQFSIEMTNGLDGGNVYWILHWLKVYEKDNIVTAAGSGGGIYDPYNLSSSVSEDNITLVWQDDNPLEYNVVFQIYRSTSENGTYSIIAVVSSKNYTDTDLDDGEYCYKVSAVFEGEESYFSNTACKTIGGPPESATLEPPVNFQAASLLGNIQLTWDRYMDFPEANYQIFRATNSNFSDGAIIIQYGNGATSLHDDNIIVGTTYYYRIRCELNGEVSNFSNTSSAQATGFPGPANLHVVDLTATSVKLGWDTVPNTLFYYIFRFLNGSQQWANSCFENEYIDNSVIPGEEYSYAVRAMTEDAMSDISEEVYVAVPKKINKYSGFSYLPDLDSNGYEEIAYLYKRDSDTSYISIRDAGNNQDLKLFSLGRGYLPKFISTANIDGQWNMIVTLDSLETDETILKIVGVNLASNDFILYPPENLSASDNFYTQIKLNWDRGANPEDVYGIWYEIYEGLDADSSSAEFIAKVSNVSYTVNNIMPGEECFYWMRITLGEEKTSLVGPILGSTNIVLAPNIALSEVKFNRVKLDWPIVLGAEGYIVHRDDIFIKETSSNYFTDTMVAPETEYGYRVFAFLGSFVSESSNEIITTTPNVPMYQVENFQNFAVVDDYVHSNGYQEFAYLGVNLETNCPVIHIVDTGDESVVQIQISEYCNFDPKYIGLSIQNDFFLNLHDSENDSLFVVIYDLNGNCLSD